MNKLTLPKLATSVFMLFAALVFVTQLTSGHVFAAGPTKKRPTLVVTEKVASHQISQSLTLVGKLEAQESVSISSEVSGKIEAIKVSANQKVNKGDLLVQLNGIKARAALAEARAYSADEKRKLEEYRRLAKKGAITQTEIDAQQASVDIANARLDAARADFADLNITAPFAGTVGFIDFSLGKLVNSGEDLLHLDNLSTMQLDLQVPESYLALLSEKMPVEATSNAWPEVIFHGTVMGVDSRINSETLNLRVRILFDNQDGRLKPGMLLSANLVFPPIQAPIIPVQALQYAGTKRYVYVIGENNKAKKTEVILGARVENRVVIEKGLQLGDRIVVQGVVNMRDGATVTEQGSGAAGKGGKALSAKETKGKASTTRKVADKDSQ